MEISVFTDKSYMPSTNELKQALGKSYLFWQEIRDYVVEKYPEAKEEWNFPGQKYGWSFRMKDKKRAILYLLPRAGFFKAAFVFGQKAFDAILLSDVSDEIKSELQAANVYAEGRGVRIAVTDDDILVNIKRLVDIKMNN